VIRSHLGPESSLSRLICWSVGIEGLRSPAWQGPFIGQWV
jgi:hypothetical protein